VLAQARRHRQPPRIVRRKGGRTALGDTFVGLRTAVGVRPCVPELPRPGPPGIGTGVLRDELRAAATRQATIRPRQRLPLSPVASGSEVTGSRQRSAPAPLPTVRDGCPPDGHRVGTYAHVA